MRPPEVLSSHHQRLLQRRSHQRKPGYCIHPRIPARYEFIIPARRSWTLIPRSFHSRLAPVQPFVPKMQLSGTHSQVRRRTERLSRVGSEVTNLAPRRRTLPILHRDASNHRRSPLTRVEHGHIPLGRCFGCTSGYHTQHDHKLEVVTKAFRGTDAPDEFTWLVR